MGHRVTLLPLLAMLVLAWTAGQALAVIPTDDPLWTWQNPLPRGVSVDGVAPLGDDGAWMVGSGSEQVFHTDDGGGAWSTHDAFSAFGACAVVFTDAQHGRAVGTDTPNPATSAGIAYRSDDDGLTWQSARVFEGPSAGFDALSFADQDHGWAVGPFGAVWATSDGGSTWDEQSSGASADLTAVCFVDTQVGWCAGTGGTIIAMRHRDR